MCIIDEETNDNSFMERLTRPLFGNLSDSLDVSPRDVILYGVTCNIRPGQLMNNRRWNKYDHDKQKAILTRIESKLRRENPSIVLKKLMFEVCPTLNNIHFHALYEMPGIFESTVEAYYERVCNNDKSNIQKWRVIDVQPVYDEEGWIKYITKDEKA